MIGLKNYVLKCIFLNKTSVGNGLFQMKNCIGTYKTTYV